MIDGDFCLSPCPVIWMKTRPLDQKKNASLTLSLLRQDIQSSNLLITYRHYRSITLLKSDIFPRHDVHPQTVNVIVCLKSLPAWWSTGQLHFEEKIVIQPLLRVQRLTQQHSLLLWFILKQQTRHSPQSLNPVWANRPWDMMIPTAHGSPSQQQSSTCLQSYTDVRLLKKQGGIIFTFTQCDSTQTTQALRCEHEDLTLETVCLSMTELYCVNCENVIVNRRKHCKQNNG